MVTVPQVKALPGMTPLGLKPAKPTTLKFAFMRSAITHTAKGQHNIVALYNGRWSASKMQAMANRLSEIMEPEQAKAFVESRFYGAPDTNAEVEFGDIWFSYKTDSSGGSFGLEGAIIEQFNN